MAKTDFSNPRNGCERQGHRGSDEDYDTIRLGDLAWRRDSDGSHGLWGHKGNTLQSPVRRKDSGMSRYDDRGSSPLHSESSATRVIQQTRRKENCSTCCCNKDWVDFTEVTSLHGLRYIWLQDASCLRRMMWLVLSLICLAIMWYQILDRVIHYYDWPVTVNVRINYNDSLQFPAVTMCNQNAFRASRADALGRYALISDMYDDDSPFNTSQLRLYNASDLTFQELYAGAGHTIEDMVLRCSWHGEPCGAYNFTEMATAHGRCFSFNLEREDGAFLKVNAPGSQDGLSLTLNVEQYEYMPGPQDAAGLKVLLHHPDQFPNVKGLGVVLPAGTHAFVGTKLLSVHNLPKPHGQCSSPTLRHFRHYSSESCHIECEARILEKLCSCRLHYMPGETDGVPVCTLSQYYSCYKEKLSLLRKLTRDQCVCPVPCDFLMFDTSVSYANTSPMVAERFLASVNRSALKRRYDAARDVTHRRERERRRILSALIDNLSRHFGYVRELVAMDIVSKLEQHKTALAQVRQDFTTVYDRLLYLCQYQSYIVEKDFIRARDAMNERTLSVVAMAMQEFSFLVQTSIQQLADVNITSDSVRQVIYLEVTRQLEGRIDIAQRALQNYTQFRTALESGEPIFNYMFRREPRANSIYIVPVPLFHQALNISKSIRHRTKFLKKNLLQMIAHLETFKDIAFQTYQSTVLNASALHHTSVQYLYICREYLQSRDQFLNDVPEWITAKLSERENDLQRHRARFDVAGDDLERQVESLFVRLSLLRQGTLGDVTSGLQLARDFLTYGNVSKKGVASQFLKDEVQQAQSTLKNFFDEVRTRGHTLYDDWLELGRTAEDVWVMAIDDVNLRNYYQTMNMSEFLVNSTEKVVTVAAEFDGYRNDLDLRHVVGHVDEDFLQSLAVMLKEMRTFKETEEIDSQFMQKNVLRLNIFYRELNYEEVMQQEAYDIFALLCDIGGSMGLFIGASVLTVFEILDLILFTWAARFGGRRQ